jgi:hypothetical protein
LLLSLAESLLVASVMILSKEQSSATKKGGVVIYKVGTDNIITEATNRLSARLKSKYGEDSVVLLNGSR